jgi:hypothetical protein
MPICHVSVSSVSNTEFTFSSSIIEVSVKRRRRIKNKELRKRLEMIEVLSGRGSDRVGAIHNVQ